MASCLLFHTHRPDLSCWSPTRRVCSLEELDHIMHNSSFWDAAAARQFAHNRCMPVALQSVGAMTRLLSVRSQFCWWRCSCALSTSTRTPLTHASGTAIGRHYDDAISSRAIWLVSLQPRPPSLLLSTSTLSAHASNTTGGRHPASPVHSSGCGRDFGSGYNDSHSIGFSQSHPGRSIPRIARIARVQLGL